MAKFFLLIVLSLTALFAKESHEISLQLQWKYQFQFAGYIVAKEKGFYKNVGLDVKIKEWSDGIDMVDELIEQRSQYAVVRPSSLIDIAKGKKVIYLATIFQSSPLILLADKSSGISSIQDFKGKTLMTTGDLNSDTSLISMMFSQGVKLEDMKILKPSFDVKDLLNATTDLMASYISNEPFMLKKLGGDPVIFSPKDYGFDFYNDILATDKEYLAKHPQEVKNFRKASLQGWEYAFSHIDETVDIIYNKYNTQHKTKELLLYEARELKKLAYFKTDTIGKIEKEKLSKIYDVYKLLGLIKNQEIDFNELIYNQFSVDVILSEEEKKYLHDRQIIRMCIDPNWIPFEHFDKKGNYEGMSADYYKLFEKNLNVKFEPVHTKTWSESIEFAKERKCDIFSLAMSTPEREKYMSFTTPYLKIPLVITTKLDIPFVNEIKDLRGKRVGISKGYAFYELLKAKYPDLNLVEVDDIDDGLKKVNDGTIFGYIGTLASVGYRLQRYYSGELKIAGKIEDNWELGIGVRNDDPILLTILQKAINQVSAEQKREILNRWISIKYEKGTDYTMVYKVVGFFSFIIFFGLFFMQKQQTLKRKLQDANEKLEIAYAELEQVAVTDKLTQLFNRHKLDKTLQSEKNRADRYDQMFGIMILDIDHFKVINDTYGHHVGDVVLQEFAAILVNNSRESDIIGRWGGEEFLIIVPQGDFDSMNYFAHNLKNKIQSHLFVSSYKITTSIGITVYRKYESLQTTLSRADEALYVAKNSGRNLVVGK